MESTHADAIAEIGVRFPNDILPPEMGGASANVPKASPQARRVY